MLQHRRRCRSSLLTWCGEALAPFDQTPAAHHRLLIEELEAVAHGENDRLMIFMPPGSAKSTYASVLFPAWFMARRPNQSIIGASSTADLAQHFSRKVQSVVRDNGGTLAMHLRREGAELWSTDNGGQYRAAGVGGTIAGYRADLAILDDVVKSRAVAESEVEREKQWNWFNSDLRTRLRPNASIVLIMTRWHMDDLGGRLLETQLERWRVLTLPATALPGDQLGRAPGALLWADDPSYPYANELRRVKAECEANGAMRDWSALYEQNPRPAEGALFQVARIATLDAPPAGGQIVRGWDLAATEQIGTADPDWTAGIKLQMLPDGRFSVLDVTRLRGGPEAIERAIVNTAAADGRDVRIGLPQDPGQAGKAQVRYLTTALRGYRVESSPETGDKTTRAAPAASQVNVGNFSVMRASWNHAFIEELRDFPSGRKDDQVDALSRAFSLLINPAQPARGVHMSIMAR